MEMESDSKGRVLVVGLESSLGFIVEDFLFREGYSSRILGEDENASNLLKYDQRNFDVILADASSYSARLFASQMHAKMPEGGRRPYIIIISSAYHPGIDRYADDHVGRPFTLNEVVSKISDWAERCYRS